MATTFLPPIVHSPFGRGFDANACSMLNTSHQPFNGLRWDGTRLVSGIKPVRVVSLPTSTPSSSHKFDENNVQLDQSQDALTPSNRRAHSLTTEAFPAFEDALLPSDVQPCSGTSLKRARRSSSQSWTWVPMSSDGVKLKGNTLDQTIGGPVENQEAPSTPFPMVHSLEMTAQNFKRWAGTFRARRGMDRCRLNSTEETTDTDMIATLRGLPISRHRTRTSNASSRFINTVKTASFSNDSISILQRPQVGRLSDHRLRSSEPRSSTDSRRPSSVLSADEAAPRRAVRRRQVLNEILSTEEQYVLDLKALHNLFSTLLASTPSMTSQLRTSIQRNVTEMLHLHEQIVNDLHRCGLRAALRDWKRPRSEAKPFRKWQSFDAPISQALAAKLRRGLISPDTRPRSYGRPEHAADAEEATEAACLLGEQVANFFIYEEYCAKYEKMAQELANSHKMVPQWQVFEAGLEALANSVAALDHREADGKKGLTTADLLIKPVQRICRYPLLLADLYRHTPVIDCPKSHAQIENSLNLLRDAVREINMVANDPLARGQIQRRWLLQERLDFGKRGLTTAKFRMLGNVVLCGVLHVAYRTNSRIEGRYMMSLLFQDFFLLAKPIDQGKFEIAAIIYLADAKAVSAEDGRGLQCYNALYSWKVVFESDGMLQELLFSACSAVEQEQWLASLERERGRYLGADGSRSHPATDLCTTTLLDLSPLGPVFGQAGLIRRGSIQRAATVGSRIPLCPVIIKNTHKPQDGQEPRSAPFSQAINRSQSLLTTHRTVILAPKRSERVRLEHSLADIWTRDSLPYPGMSLSRGGSMIRASAGSLVRKLSLVSIHAPFSKRSVSGTHVISHGHDKPADPKPDVDDLTPDLPPPRDPLRHELVRDDDLAGETDGAHDLHVPDGTALPPFHNRSRPTLARLARLGRLESRLAMRAEGKALRLRRREAPVDVAQRSAVLTPESLDSLPESELVEERLGGKVRGTEVGKGKGKGKRRANPLGVLVGLSAGGVRGLLYSSRS